MANNAVSQKGFELPNKTYKENTLDIPDSNWVSLFIMILLWTFGTMIISILSNIFFQFCSFGPVISNLTFLLRNYLSLLKVKT